MRLKPALGLKTALVLKAAPRLAAVCLLLLTARASVHAQARSTDTPARDGRREATTRARGESSTSADEDFELNIAERRISVADYRADTAVSADGARGLRLDVGVALDASEIDVLLRNVRGRVRFRASLDAVLRLLDSRRHARSDTTPP